jgi:hypothetical protein
MTLRLRSVLALPLALVTGACGSPAAPSGTGLSGTVLRGPIQPVCSTTLPCDAAFSAGFSVRRDSARVGAFRSDAAGHFEVGLTPGNYLVVPDSDAPIISPASQTKDVVVGPSGLTTVELHFDTGIR